MAGQVKAMVLAKLQQLFGDYVSGISPENLKVQLLAGIITQENLQLKEAALAALKLPVTVRAGRIGNFTVTVPWRNLSTQPIQVEMDTLELVAQANYDLSTVSEADLVDRIKEAIAIKATELQTAELARQGREAAAANSYLEILGRKLVENLRLTISGIHLRFEDDRTKPPVAVGVTLDELRIGSTDAAWGEQTWVEPRDGDPRFKLLTISTFEVYWLNPPPEQQLLQQLAAGVDIHTAFANLRRHQLATSGDPWALSLVSAKMEGLKDPLDLPWVYFLPR